MCKEFGRSGTLCGQCDKERNYYPRAYSFDMSCTQCDGSMSSNLWKYVALAYLPLTVFYLLVFFLKLDIHSSRLCGFIIFSQFMSIPAIVRNFLQSTKIPCQLLAILPGFSLHFMDFGTWTFSVHTYDNGIFFSNQFFSNPVIGFWCCNISSHTHANYLLTSSPLLTKLQAFDSPMETCPEHYK